MTVIGFTGPTGAGKSYICEAFCKEYGYECIDADVVARRVVEKGRPCLDELFAHFGKERIAKCDELDRKALAAIVFNDKAELEFLNTVTHRYILEEMRNELSLLSQRGSECAVVDAPLLFESGFDSECDICVCVLSSKAKRKKRIIERDGISDAEAEERINAQHHDSYYIEKSDYVVFNEGAFVTEDLFSWLKKEISAKRGKQ